MKIALIPIDNRPICYDLISDILAIDSSIELFMPDISYMGDLINPSNTSKIFEFLTNLTEIDYLIVSLDTLAYGGLVSSRRCEDDFFEIKKRIEKFREIAKQKAKKILAFSSIMRISNNNINEEEKIYWSEWGKKIFAWSFNIHKSKSNNEKEEIKCEIPSEILDDYLKTRKRNFEINKIYLSWMEDNFFDTLIFSKDDCAKYGLNVKEAIELEKIIQEKKYDNVYVKTGADEIPLALISRAVNKNKNIKIKPVYLNENSINLISKYEDISVKNCVEAQLNIANCEISNNNFDLKLLINNFEKEQGDLVLGDIVNNISEQIESNQDNFFIADINNANGSDCNFIKQLLQEKTNNFFGYCGYNTSANTLGCSIFCAIIKFLAIKNNSYNDIAFKKIQFIRLLDDWAYQAIIRKYVRENAFDFDTALNQKKEELNQYSKKISKFLSYYPKDIEYSLPWKRSFEIRIKIK